MTHQPNAPALAGTTALDHLVFAPSGREDLRLKIAIAVTAALHLALLAVVMPQKPERPPTKPERATTLVLKDIRFERKPPPPEPPKPQTPKPPKPATVSVPLPEPPPVELLVDLEIPEPPPLPMPQTPVLVLPPPPAPAPPAPAPPSEPLRVGAGIELPLRTVFVEPRYSESARRIGLEGTVILDTVIDRAGRIRNVVVLRGLPMGLTEEAVRAVSKWQFEAPTMNGEPVELTYVVTVRFQRR